MLQSSLRAMQLSPGVEAENPRTMMRTDKLARRLRMEHKGMEYWGAERGEAAGRNGDANSNAEELNAEGQCRPFLRAGAYLCA